MSREFFPVSFSRQLGHVVITFRGRLDGALAARLRPLIIDVVDGQGNLDLVIDLRQATSIEPPGIGLLAETNDRVHTRGGALVVSGAGPGVQEPLEQRGLVLSPPSPTASVSSKGDIRA